MTNPLDLFEQSSAWAAAKVSSVKEDQLGDPTPCDEWDVRALVNHLTAGVKAVGSAARGEEPDPETFDRDHVGHDPVGAYMEAQESTSAALRGEADLLERTFRMPFGDSPAPAALGIFGVDQLVHGWDVAQATGQEAEMPDDLAEAAWATVDGRLTEDQRGTFFKAEVPVPAEASTQERLLGYSGRKP